MKFFSIESPLYQFLVRFWDVVKLSLLWLLCSIPLVTIGPATVALGAVTLKMADDAEGHVGRDFFKAFRLNLKKGIPLGLLLLVALEAVYLDIQLYGATESIPFLVVGLVAAFVFLLAFIYAFPLMARYENTVFRTLKNSYDIATRYFLRTLFLIAVVAVEIVVFMWNEVLLFIGVLVGPGCVMFTISSFAIRFFREIEKEPGALSNGQED